MAEIKLGTLLSEVGPRDAVHVPVIPMIADCKLKPAQRVGLVKPGVAGPSDKEVGIVDPYLTSPVKKGEIFLLCLLPGTVVGMTHCWSHPEFPSSLDSAATEAQKAISEKWLRAYAARVNCYESPEEAFSSLVSGLSTGSLHFNGSDLHGLYELPDQDELEYHASIYFGRLVRFNEHWSFSCSC